MRAITVQVLPGMQSNCVLPQGVAHLPIALLQCAVPQMGPSSVHTIVPAVDIPVAVVDGVGAVAGAVGFGGVYVGCPVGAYVGCPVGAYVGAPPTQPGGGLG
jgi:hypothetical protein